MVDQVLAFGCIVRFGVTRSGMVHVSELDVQRTAVVADAWKEGDVMDVKILEVLDNGNKLRLSRKAVLVEDAAAQVCDVTIRQTRHTHSLMFITFICLFCLHAPFIDR